MEAIIFVMGVLIGLAFKSLLLRIGKWELTYGEEMD